MRSALLALAVVGALAPAAAADDDPRSNITLTTAFAMGSFEIGDVHGFQAPGGHFDLGFRVRRWRLAAEAGFGLWSNPQAVEPSERGSFRRLGMALQWSFKDLLVPANASRPKTSHFHGYLEVGVGRQHVDGDLGSFGRNDVMLGLGISPELRLGPAVLGGDFGVRVLISRAPVTTIARGEIATSPSLDVALLYVFGLRFGH